MPYTGVQTAGDVKALPQAILDVFSMDMMHEALGIMKFENFAVPKKELGVTPGKTITMTRYNSIQRGGQLKEHETLQEKSMSASQRAITVTEWGNAIGLTEKMIQLAADDQMSEAGILLGRDFAVVNDLMLRDALALGSQIVRAGNRTTMAGLIGGTDYFDVEMVRLGVEILQTANAPKFMGDFYVCFIAPHQASYLKRDPDWIAANNYANTRALFNGEIGRWEDVIFISTTHCRNGAVSSADPGYEATFVNGATGGASSAHVYEGTLIADSAYGKAVALPAELRQKESEDYGRKHGLAWYSIMGSGILEDTFVVRMQSV